MPLRFLRLLGVATLTATACGGSDAPAARENAAPAATMRVDAAKAGSLSGRVVFDGTPPTNPVAKIGADAACMIGENASGYAFENYLVKDGGLDNVFVYVKDGLGNYQFDIPTAPVKLDQQGCRYTPHVLGLRVGQPLEIGNWDETLHNVHALPDANR